MDLGSFASTALSVAILAVALLLVGGIKLLRVQQNRRRGVLMIVAAIVLLVNVLIMAWPMA